jgi:hypothetical protein
MRSYSIDGEWVAIYIAGIIEQIRGQVCLRGTKPIFDEN